MRPAVAVLALSFAVAGCVSVPEAQRLVVLSDGGSVEIASKPCRGGVDPKIAAAVSTAGLAAEAIRITSWNLHKGVDQGWQRDLARIAADSDVVLLQEALLDDELRSALETAGLRWQLAGSFRLYGRDTGVLTAARVRPLAECTQWSLEPIYALPKSTLISRFRLAGRNATLAVANLHAINLTLAAAGAYQDQLDAIRAELASHTGPIVVAGDFNTWTHDRQAALEALARELSLSPVAFQPDDRQLFVGRAVDHIYQRGFEVMAARAITVTSSDHNPIFATLRVMRSRDD